MISIKEKEQASELSILEKVIAGETHLFEKIIRTYNTLLYKTGRSYGYNHEETEDIMQDSYINAFVSLSGFELRSSFKTWLVKIMLNNCYQKKQKFSYKYESNRSDLIDEKSKPMYSNQIPTDPSKSLLSQELKSIIEKSLEQIPVDYRLVFSLREISGLNVAETAEALNISQANVKVRLSRAKSLLRNEIEKVYSSEEIYEFDLIYCDSMVNHVMEKIKLMKV
ncbi:MAG TPA: sigma-70 family RNA polymerase sigma factor [Saprospiraceae bacterium]|nr:sigma-70 family RNA polymerase sigma factor [Saprospiraceae bacterium]